MIACRKLWAAGAAVAVSMQPLAVAAQPACINDAEMSAMAIYAVPGIVQSVQMRCGNRASGNGFLAQGASGFSARYAALRPTVWPRAQTGVLKYLGDRSRQNAQNLAMVANLPEQTVQPLLDALIVQELSPRIDPADCGAIERMMQALVPVDPEVAGTLIGLAANFLAKDDPLVCTLE